MEFSHHPHLLCLLLLLLPMTAWYVYRQLRGGRPFAYPPSRAWPERRARGATTAAISPSCCAAVPWRCSSWRWPAPARSSTTAARMPRGIDIVLAIDVSGSMLARDFRPDRITAAKEVAAFVRGRSHRRPHRPGGFRGRSLHPEPLTTDKGTLQTLLAVCAAVWSRTARPSATAWRRRSTACARATRSRRWSSCSPTARTTPGRSRRSRRPASPRPRESGSHTIGVGTQGKASYPFVDMFGQVPYRMAEVKIDEKTLREMAEATGAATSAPRTRRSLRPSTRRSTASKRARWKFPSSPSTTRSSCGGCWPPLVLLAAEFLLSHFVFRKNSVNHVPIRQSALPVAACGRAGARGAGLAVAAAPTAPHGAFRRARIAGRPRARNGSGALAAQIPALRRCPWGCWHSPPRASAGRLENSASRKPKAWELMLVVDVSNSMLAEDFRAQPSGAYEVCHRPPLSKGLRPGAHRSRWSSRANPACSCP